MELTEEKVKEIISLLQNEGIFSVYCPYSKVEIMNFVNNPCHETALELILGRSNFKRPKTFQATDGNGYAMILAVAWNLASFLLTKEEKEVLVDPWVLENHGIIPTGFIYYGLYSRRERNHKEVVKKIKHLREILGKELVGYFEHDHYGSGVLPGQEEKI